VVEPRDHGDLDVRVQRAQDRQTIAFPPAGGGLRSTACSDTENGSAKTATSVGTSSGTACSIVLWAGISSA
jgi:hypothetical protein